jgi:hypothetical protein
MDKVKAKRFWISQSESARADIDRNFDSWDRFDGHLNWIAQAAPKGGAYDKTTLHVEYENGEVLDIRMDIKHSTEVSMPYCLADFLFHRAAVNGRVWKPAWMDEYPHPYFAPESHQKRCKDFLANYELPVKALQFKEILESFIYVPVVEETAEEKEVQV